MAYITGVIHAREWQVTTQVLATGREVLQVHDFRHPRAPYSSELTPGDIFNQEMNVLLDYYEENPLKVLVHFCWPDLFSNPGRPKTMGHLPVVLGGPKYQQGLDGYAMDCQNNPPMEALPLENLGFEVHERVMCFL